MSDELSVVEHLELGKATILDKGWSHGEGEDQEGDPYCASTALTHRWDPHYRAHHALARAAGIVIPEDPVDLLEAIYRWNDAPERTKEEVLATFDKAIEAESAAV